VLREDLRRRPFDHLAAFLAGEALPGFHAL
jgi:hypothetical protein